MKVLQNQVLAFVSGGIQIPNIWDDYWFPSPGLPVENLVMSVPNQIQRDNAPNWAYSSN